MYWSPTLFATLIKQCLMMEEAAKGSRVPIRMRAKREMETMITFPVIMILSKRVPTISLNFVIYSINLDDNFWHIFLEGKCNGKLLKVQIWYFESVQLWTGNKLAIFATGRWFVNPAGTLSTISSAISIRCFFNIWLQITAPFRGVADLVTFSQLPHSKLTSLSMILLFYMNFWWMQ